MIQQQPPTQQTQLPPQALQMLARLIAARKAGKGLGR